MKTLVLSLIFALFVMVLFSGCFGRMFGCLNQCNTYWYHSKPEANKCKDICRVTNAEKIYLPHHGTIDYDRIRR